MTDVTAGYSAGLRIRRPILMLVPADSLDAATGERMPPACLLSDSRPEAEILAPHIEVPNWLPDVERRIVRSIMPADLNSPDSGEWLTLDIANAGLAFFNTTADLLPSEPFIYCAGKGDLVAEFERETNPLTIIVSLDSVLLFSIIDDEPVYQRVQFSEGPAALRRRLRNLIGTPRAAQHGAVDSQI